MVIFLCNNLRISIDKNSWRKLLLARCLGYREGTGCTHLSRYTQKRENWENWQLCHKCARILHPEYYKDKRNHGVRKAAEIKLEDSLFNLIQPITE